jgi:hypothetical protein
VRVPWQFFLALGVASFGLNWLWETVQRRAYTEAMDRPWYAVAIQHIVPTLGDAVVTFAVYGVGALAAGQFRWGTTGRWNVYATAALLGGACAVVVEWKALASGWWSYADVMPIVPVLGVGLWPLLQLTLLVPLALWLAAAWSRRA